jgi:hypothetical protein
MAILRDVVQFFKTWFLPTPAHDDPRYGSPAEERSSDPVPPPAAVGAPAEAASVSEPEQDFHSGVNDEPGAEELPYGPEVGDPDYPERVPMHPVAPPEAAEERASRSPSPSPVNPFSPE